ncbi:MAG: hypothetical protein QMD50_02005 [Patescibacteria group bacterium]|nr:hypothetical protein [Patescibacteria group bacterium]
MFFLGLSANKAIITSSFQLQTAFGANSDTVYAKEINGENSDVNTRQKIFIDILDSSKTEINELKERISDLQLESDDWKKTRDNFINRLSEYRQYYNDLENKITGENTTIDEIKSIAKELKEWREKEYTPRLKEISNMILIFESENFLKTAKNRLDKVLLDLKKLEKQKFVKIDSLKFYYLQSSQKFKNAKELNENAKSLFYNSLNSIDDKKTSSNDKVTANTGAPTDTSEKSSKITDQESIKNILKNSLKELKATYELFFQMNERLKNSK